MGQYSRGADVKVNDRQFIFEVVLQERRGGNPSAGVVYQQADVEIACGLSQKFDEILAGKID
jgi:hypothetical protein